MNQPQYEMLRQILQCEMGRADFWKSQHDQWISVAEELPEAGTPLFTVDAVLAWDGLMMEVAWWDGSEWTVHSGGDFFPTHWKHLPDPPVSDEEDDEEENEGKTVLKWFSCDHKVPPLETDCLVYVNGRIREAHYDAGGFWSEEDAEYLHVSYWMPPIPLPE